MSWTKNMLSHPAMYILNNWSKHQNHQGLVQDDSQAQNSENGGEDDEVPFETHGYIAKVTIANGLYTITDYEGTVLVDGKSAKTKTERPNISK